MGTCTDANGVTFQNIGTNDCRADIVLVDLTSATDREVEP
jgi:hypothetical protein